MPSKDPIIGNSKKKRLIYPNLIVWKDTRKAIGGDGILEIQTKPPNPSQDIECRVFCHWGSSKQGSLGWKYVGKGFGLKWPLWYLIRAVRVSFDSQPTYARSTLCTQSQSCVRRPIPMYARCLVEAHSPLFWAWFFTLRHSQGSYGLKGHLKHIPSMKFQALKKQYCMETYN